MPNSIISVSGGNWVVLDVAGKEFRTSRGSMQREPGSLLALMVDGTMDPDELCNESNGRIYSSDEGWSIDMDPRVFEALLKYLRTGKLVGRLPEGVTDEDLKSEAEFLRLPKLMELCDMSSSSPRDNSSISMMGSRYASTMSLYQHQHFPTINEPPPGIPIRPSHPPDFGHSVTATTAAAVGAHIAAPPGFRAPPGFDIGLSDSRTTNKFDNSSNKSADIFSSRIDNTGSLSNISSDLASNKFDIDGYKPDIISGKSESGSKFDISSNKFDISEALKEAFNSDPTDNSTATVVQQQSLSALSPRSQNVQEAQNARLPMSSSFSSNENLHSISQREPSPPPVAHTVAPASPPAPSASFARAQYYQLSGPAVLNFQQAHQQMENRANEILTMVDGQASPDRSLYQRFANLGAVLHALQRLHRLHPDGFTVEQYVQFENRQKRGRPTQEGFFFNNIMPTVVSLLESDDDLLRVDRKNGTFHVSAEVAQTRLFCLGKNLCSNLYRLLRRYSDNAIRVQQLFDIAPKLVPKGAPAPDTNALLALCNCHPTIFKLCCSPQDNYRFDTAWIMLNDLLLNNIIFCYQNAEFDYQSQRRRLVKYLRTGKLVGRLPEGVTDEDLKSEAEFLRLPKLMELCDMSSSSPRDNSTAHTAGHPRLGLSVAFPDTLER
uniref:BTB domain-containing protein n=1 Tax=Globodera rostochiensis TaxID=31243 RepID=A0A914I731_GLORO